MNPRIARFRLASAALAGRSFPTHAIFEAFRSVERILDASPEELRRIEGIHPATVHALVSLGEGPCSRGELAFAEQDGLRVVSYDDAEYPENLRDIQDPPPVLFLRGRILSEDKRAIAVIGSRKASAYGISVCERLVRELVDQGFHVVSGMAKGVDTAAHWAALECQGRTLAVLGTGVDVVYPKANRPVFDRIPRQGALVSEFLPGTLPLARNFPRRNRIISGMGLGVLVVEAAERSGTMITVRTALEQGREVFAVPGDVRSALSRGTHRLIKQGAKLVETIEDVLEELPAYTRRDMARHSQPPCPKEASGFLTQGVSDTAASEVSMDGTETLMGLLSDEGTGMDLLIERTGWPSEKMATLLTELELIGKVRRLPGNRFLRAG